MNVNGRTRLCETVLGEDNYANSKEHIIFSLPFTYEDITADILHHTLDGIFEASPAELRRVLPLVLMMCEDENDDLLGSGCASAFFTVINHPFYKDDFQGPLIRPHSYSDDYKENWIAPTLRDLSAHELAWAHDWASKILAQASSSFLFAYGPDLVMFCRVLGMAGGIPETEAPKLPTDFPTG